MRRPQLPPSPASRMRSARSSTSTSTAVPSIAPGRQISQLISATDLTACRHCHVDITLKDVETVEGDPDRVRNWVGLCREVIDEVFE
jgi:hypothetical protein